MPMEPEVTYTGVLDMQVCVPENYTDEQIIAFANEANPCGTTAGWAIRKQGSTLLAGQKERVACDDNPVNRVHIMLDA